MNGKEFLRRAKRYAKKNRLTSTFWPERGKGSPGILVIGEGLTTVQRGELSKAMMADMLRQLKIPRTEFFR